MFSTHIPAGAVGYCEALQRQYPFRFRLSRPRKTRFGDFRALPDRTTHITVNADLNPYAFLLTLVHEIAHCAVYHTYRRPGKPHGRTWQTTFQRLMTPLLTEALFPPDVLAPLRTYLSRPAATTSGHPALRQALSRYDRTGKPLPANAASDLGGNVPGSHGPVLRQLPEGQVFQLRGKTYVRGTLRRTRVVCKEVQSGRSYAVLADVEVLINVQ
jgi:hypothetical protein